MARRLAEKARSVGIPISESHNGRMMEWEGGASIIDVRVRDAKRQSVFRAYTFPMAPCVIIGERAAEVLRAEHKL